MTLTEQVYAQAAVLAGSLSEKEQAMLELLCRNAVSSITARLRPGLTQEDCRADFIAAASLYALAALSAVAGDEALAEMKLGDVTVKRGGGTAAVRCLRNQAELIMAPYLRDRFGFRRV